MHTVHIPTFYGIPILLLIILIHHFHVQQVYWA